MLITGARQVGKSTILENMFPDLFMATFDPELDILSARKDPELFLQEHPAPIILDEIQYVPQLLNVIKRVVDRSEACPQYLMTGSQNLSTLQSVAESLAGRVTILPLAPMTIYEQLGMTEKPTWLERYLAHPHDLKSYVTGVVPNLSPIRTIWRGGMPGYLDLPEDLLQDKLQSYVQTYIQRDVRTLGSVKDLEDFTAFFGLVAALTAQEINYEQLGRDLDMAGASAKKWIALLKQSYQWKDIPAYSGNTIKRVSSKPKGYFTDTGLACLLQRVPSPEALRSHPLRGALFETLIVNTIDTILSMLPFKAQLYHWRTGGGAEVDLVIAFDNKLYPIEIKMQTNISKYDARGLAAFRETYAGKGPEVMPGLIIYAGTDCYRIEENTLLLPWHCLVR
ncbi:MAG: ATP-binding protein [Candidatus Dependentiae bacterium]|nr:ATP-binding protein [Candidatus Dependentiae bacterium]